MRGLLLFLALSGCGMGGTIGGTVGSVAGGAVDLVLRSDTNLGDLR